MGSGNIFLSGSVFQSASPAGGRWFLVYFGACTVGFGLLSTATCIRYCWIWLFKISTGRTILILLPQEAVKKNTELIQFKDLSGTQWIAQHFFQAEGIAKASLPACFCCLISICDISEPHLQLCFPEWSHKWPRFECFVTSILLEGMGLFISQEPNRSQDCNYLHRMIQIEWDKWVWR